MEGAHTYRVLAEQDQDPTRQQILLELAEAEEQHAVGWAERLHALGSQPPPLRESLPQQARDRVIKGGGAMAVIRKMEADEDRDITRYRRQLAELHDADAERMIQRALADEEQHRRRLAAITRKLLI